MALLFLIGGLICVGIAFGLMWNSLFDGTLKEVLKLCIMLVFIGFISLWIPTIDNEPISMEVVTLKTDTYEDMKFDDIVTIQYETRKHNWWTYKFLDDGSRKDNLKVITK